MKTFKKLSTLLFCFVLMFAFAAPADAAKKVTPTALPGGTVVSADTVKGLVGKMGVHIFDMRKAINYGKGHVPGAVSAPYKWLNKDKDPAKRTGAFDTSRLPADKNVTMVFYSDGPTGWKSYYASKWAIDNGYTKVLYMREGSAGWRAKGFKFE